MGLVLQGLVEVQVCSPGHPKTSTYKTLKILLLICSNPFHIFTALMSTLMLSRQRREPFTEGNKYSSNVTKWIKTEEVETFLFQTYKCKKSEPKDLIINMDKYLENCFQALLSTVG